MLVNMDDQKNDLRVPEDCKAGAVITGEHELVDCPVENPLCRYLLYFGNAGFCRYPQRKEIVEHTKRKNQSTW